MKRKKNIFDVIEGYYIAHILLYLSDKGFFNETSARKRKQELYPDIEILQLLSDSTNIIIREGDTFRLNPIYESYMDLAFHIEKFIGAYGEFDTDKKGLFIKTNIEKFSKAYKSASAYSDHTTILSIFAKLKVGTLLDLGCGNGGLILNFCRQNVNNKGIGIDQNSFYRYTNKSGKPYHRRAKFILGSVTDFDNLLTSAEIIRIDAIYGSSIFNEFFYYPDQFTTLLIRLRQKFPNKYLIIDDYYGSFNSSKANNPDLQHNYIHDVMQIFSRQGLPPANHKEWNKYYKKAGCDLLYVYEGRSNGIDWFIHILKLNAA